jgi:hypothetical protein
MMVMRAGPSLFGELPPDEKSSGRLRSRLASEAPAASGVFADVVFDRPVEQVYTYALNTELSTKSGTSSECITLVRRGKLRQLREFSMIRR